MQMRRLGRNGPLVSAMGLGCMGMSDFYGVRDEGEALATIDRALELGVNFFDTADVYGPHTNEELVGRAMRGRRERFIIATKFGLVREPGDRTIRGVCGEPEYVRRCADASLRRLGVDVIDLYYLHRVDPATPIEETVGAMADLVRAGKVRHLGLSEVSAATLERACAVHPIAALQTEYSLWTREPAEEMLGTCRRLGVGYVAYSPLGRGFLTGAIQSPQDFVAEDYRRFSPRFQGENFHHNLELVARVRVLAERLACTPAQLALAWVLAQGDDIVPIPGTKRCRYLEDNVGALQVRLGQSQLAELSAAFLPGSAVGERYPEAIMRMLDT